MGTMLALLALYQFETGFKSQSLGFLVPLGMCMGIQIWLWMLSQRIGSADQIETIYSVDERGVKVVSFVNGRRLVGMKTPWKKVRVIDREEIGFDLIINGSTNRFHRTELVPEEARQMAISHAKARR